METMEYQMPIPVGVLLSCMKFCNYQSQVTVVFYNLQEFLAWHSCLYVPAALVVRYKTPIKQLPGFKKINPGVGFVL